MQKSSYAGHCLLAYIEYIVHLFLVSQKKRKFMMMQEKQISIIQEAQEVIDKQKICQISDYSSAEFTTLFLFLRHNTVLQSEFFICVSNTRNQTDKIIQSCFILFLQDFFS